MREVYVGATWRTIIGGEIFVGGQWRRLTGIDGYLNGAWRSVANFVPAFSVSASPASVSGSRRPPFPSYGVVTSVSTIVTPSGGVAPFNYVWQTVSGIAQATRQGNAITAFSAGVGPDERSTSTVRVTVTDSAGATATATVSVTLTNISTA